MSVLLSDVKFYAADVTPEDDSVTGVGGAVLTSKKFDFTDFSTASQVVSDALADDFQTITVTYRDADGEIQTVSISLNGTLVVADPTVFDSVLKAVKSASCAGNVALESQTTELTGTLFALGSHADEVVLPIGASPIDGFYTGMVFRALGVSASITPGAGSLDMVGRAPIVQPGASASITPSAGSLAMIGRIPIARTGESTDLTPSAGSLTAAGVAPTVQVLGASRIAEVIDYVGATRTATLSRGVVGTFDNTTVFRISKGVFFDKTPAEITYVVRMDFNSQADLPGHPEIDFYEKGYFKHTDASASGLALTLCVISIVAAPSGRVTTALDAAINGSGDNGAGNNRQVAPLSGVTAFDGTDKPVPGGSLAPGDVIGMWMRLADPGGGPELRTTWTPGFQGATV